MVEFEIAAKAASTAIHETEKAVQDATPDHQQDAGEQAAREMEKTAKAAIRAFGWGSHSKSHSHEEEVTI